MYRMAVLAAVLVLASALRADADLFDRAVEALFTTEETTQGMYVGDKTTRRAVVRYPVNIQRAQDSFRISTPCGSWSLSPQGVMKNLEEMLDPDRLKAALMSAIQNSIQNLVGAVVSKLSMLTVCYAVPTLCDLTKHMQAVSGQLHNIRALSCQQLEGMVNNVASSMVAGRTSRCIQGQIQEGLSLNVAQRVCSSGEWDGTITNPGQDGGLGLWGDANVGTNPDGGAFPPDPNKPMTDTDREQREEQKVVSDTLDFALARAGGNMLPAEKTALKHFAWKMVGEVTIKDDAATTGDDEPAKTETKPELPKWRLHDEYESQHSHMSQLLACAISQVGNLGPGDSMSTATCSVTYAPAGAGEEIIDGDATTLVPATVTEDYNGVGEILQGLSVPGAELPPSVVTSLYRRHQLGDERRVMRHVNNLAGTMAMMRTVWLAYQLRDELEAGMLSKDDQTEEEREQVLMRVRRLEREADRFVAKRRLAEEMFLPIVEEIATEDEVLAERRLRELGMPDFEVTLGKQTPFGYGF